MTEINKQVLRILETAHDAYGELFEACNDLYESLLNLIGINAEQENYRQNLSLDSGKAIGLTWAAMCIKDIMRTKKFMDGVSNATRDCLKNNKRPIQILYAGTGPFATLMLPLTAQFSSEEIQFTLLEINGNSFNCLQTLINKLKLENYIHRLENADATQWRLPANQQIDLFICETMTQGLQSEPQVAICINIVPQLTGQTILIPEEISLRAALINPKTRMERKLGLGLKDKKDIEDDIIVIEDILKLNRNTIRKLSILKDEKNRILDTLPPIFIALDHKASKAHRELYALTEVTIYGEQKLIIDESALTIPLKLVEVDHSTNIQLQYLLGKNPGIKIIKKFRI
jgi:predicted RNA methylase